MRLRSIYLKIDYHVNNELNMNKNTSLNEFTLQIHLLLNGEGRKI
jgi:hypothetical protein